MCRARTGRLLSGVIAAGCLAAVLDLLYAFVLAALRDATPLRVLQSIASGLLGPAAYDGGIPAALLGLICHVGILIVAAGIFCLGALALRYLREHLLIAGAIFGASTYLFMNFVVLPLSAVPFRLAYPGLVILQGLVSHAVLVGLPIAWVLKSPVLPGSGQHPYRGLD